MRTKRAKTSDVELHLWNFVTYILSVSTIGPSFFWTLMAKLPSSKNTWAQAEPPMASENQSESSFRPIILCFKSFGFDVHWGTQQPYNCRLISSCYSLTWLVINIVAAGWTPLTTTCIQKVAGSYTRMSNTINIFYLAIAVQIAGGCESLTLAPWHDGGQLADPCAGSKLECQSVRRCR